MRNATHRRVTWGSDATNEASWSGEHVKEVLGMSRESQVTRGSKSVPGTVRVQRVKCEWAKKKLYQK